MDDERTNLIDTKSVALDEILQSRHIDKPRSDMQNQFRILSEFKDVYAAFKIRSYYYGHMTDRHT